MARLPAGAGTPLAALFLFLCLLSSCRAAGSGSGDNPRAVVLPVSKDAGATQQYVTSFRQRTPLVPVKAVLDLSGATLWVDCDSGRYASTTYRRVPCGSKPCRRLSRSAACATSCPGAPSPSCLNDTCGGFPSNTVTHVSTGGNVIADVLSLPTTFRPAPAGPLATAPAFLFTCGATFLTEGLAAGAAGMASLSRARFALPSQLAATFRFPRRFALCLPPAGSTGAAVRVPARVRAHQRVARVHAAAREPGEHGGGVGQGRQVGRVLRRRDGHQGERPRRAAERDAACHRLEERRGRDQAERDGAVHRAGEVHLQGRDGRVRGGNGVGEDPACTRRGAVHAVLRRGQGREHARGARGADRRAGDGGRRRGVVGGVRGELDGGRQGRGAVPRRGGRRRGAEDVGGDRGPHDGGQPAGVRPRGVAARVQLLAAVPADQLQQLPPRLA